MILWSALACRLDGPVKVREVRESQCESENENGKKYLVGRLLVGNQKWKGGHLIIITNRADDVVIFSEAFCYFSIRLFVKLHGRLPKVAIEIRHFLIGN
jgi:hypothetical protein